MDGIVTDLYIEPYDVDSFVFSYKNRDKPSFLMTSLVENKYTSFFKKKNGNLTLFTPRQGRQRMTHSMGEG